tara:strand:- start:351 stop:452 length:102 start_codon:yes stop_codon:yes gene_type:complete
MVSGAMFQHPKMVGFQQFNPNVNVVEKDIENSR